MYYFSSKTATVIHNNIPWRMYIFMEIPVGYRIHQPNGQMRMRTAADLNTSEATCSALYASPSTLLGTTNYSNSSHDQRNLLNHSRWWVLQLRRKCQSISTVNGKGLQKNKYLNFQNYQTYFEVLNVYIKY